MPANDPLDDIAYHVTLDPGLKATISGAEIAAGVAAARLMNDVIDAAIDATGVNADGVVTPSELRQISAYIRSDDELYAKFVEGHGNDEGNVETGFHLVQGDGGTLKFQGRNFVNTVADALYHVGFSIRDGRFRNEDGDQNEQVDDVAGWLNFFLNDENRVFGTGQSETLHSGTYSGVFSDAEDEIFDAGGGNDTIWASTGDDIVYAGTGDDTSGGGTGNDTLYGEGGNDTLWGEDGNDTLMGGGGHDTLGGGNGNDLMEGHSGNDTLWAGAGNDTVSGGTGADRLGGGAGNDTLDGGSGADKVWGEDGDDTLSGGNGNDEMGGGNGNDILDGGSGRDVISGGNGDDVLDGGSGADTVWGGSGSDTLSGGAHRDTLGGGSGDDEIDAGSGNDIVYGEDGKDVVLGGSGHDEIHGGNGNDDLSGDAGNDEIHGGDNNDTMRGGDGRDELFGGTGQDIFVGGVGADKLIGWEKWESRDIFVIGSGDTGTLRWNSDVIEGFKSGTDKIDLTGFEDLSYVEGSFSGGNGGEVYFDGDYVRIDENGDGALDAMFELRYVNSVNESDFIL